ncbi:bifunctional diguanylate cyclase/phosphodiesterase [Natronospira bacteriovora]|uniref:EAL domain-containing protein n=1 Tax=Natronospira bacteriovora TaxID=3069753 RepID=A0ABU0W4D1_9GAMM|nr:EAL domain-containing protein [Natronospira sp. AB-CW4]MDQ2068876.1 EAL domain-containing protein [Natronospira sp. AB-CW4]
MQPQPGVAAGAFRADTVTGGRVLLLLKGGFQTLPRNLVLGLILGGMLLVSLGAWRLALDAERVELQSELHARLGDISREIETQMGRYFSLLRAGSATLALIDDLEASDWERFVAGLSLARHYPNITSLHYITRVPRDQADSFEANMRAGAYPEFRIRSESSLGYFCVLTHSALDTGAARGFDACQNPTPRALLAAATQQATPLISGRLVFTPADRPGAIGDPIDDAGFILVVPVYSAASMARGVPSGWLGIVLRVDAAFRELGDWHGDYHLRVVDISDDAAGSVIIDTNPAEQRGYRIEASQSLPLGNRDWLIQLSHHHSASLFPWTVLASGLSISFLLFFLFRGNYLTRSRAEALADQMTRAYRESERRRQRTEEISLIMVTHLDADGLWLKVPPRLPELLDLSEAELLGRPARDSVYPLDVSILDEAMSHLLDGKEESAQIELRLQSQSGRAVWVEMSLSSVAAHDGQPRYFLAFLQDVSERKQWEQELENRDRLLEAISRSLDDLIAPGQFGPSVNKALETIAEAMDVDRAYIFTNHPHSTSGLPAHSMRYEWVREGITAEIENPRMQNLPYADFPEFWYDRLNTGRPVIARPRELSGEARALLEAQSIQSLLLVPIMMRGGFFGFVGLDDCRSERLWPDSQLTALLAAAASLGNAFERQETEEALEHNRRLLSSITDNISEGIYRSTPAGHLEYVNSALAGMFGYDSPEEMMRVPAPIHYVSPGRRRELQQLVTEQGGYRDEEVEFLRRDGSRFVALNSAVAIHDEVEGVTYLDGVISDITERKEAEKKINYLAHYDTLTGLPNRTLLRDRMEQAIAKARRDNTYLAVLFIDLDRFKNVNDSLGHAVGDRLLEEVARRLKRDTRAEDTVSRQGGDEFIVLLPGIEEANRAAQVATKLLSSLGQPYRVGNHELHVTPSIGISLYPNDAEDLDELIRNADAAMYQAKERGRYNFQFFTHDLSIQAWERLSLENQLRRAIQRNEFVLYYQPQVSLETGEIVGVEALVRWRHEGRLISPAVFIPVAEQTGMIIEIGDWVLHEACQQMRSWMDEGLASLPISVNLSALQFRRRDIRSHIQEALTATGLPPDLLELELTESTVMEEVEESVRMLGQLSRLGVGLCIDDFGTGYSSLSYLKRFPIDKLKIDQSFVSDIPDDSDDAAITGAVIDLGHNLNLRICAEGVETREQLHFLRDRGCQEMQGFLFSRPIPASAMADMLREQARLDVAS